MPRPETFKQGTLAYMQDSLPKDLLADIVGTGLFAVGVQCFTAPNRIAPGGITGISVLVNYVSGWPISILSFVLNIPLLLLAWIFLGHSFTLRTLKTVGIMTVMLELAHRYLPVYQGEPILAALSGGVLGGIGLSLVFMRSSTTGGSDVASRLIQLRFPYMPVGRLMLLFDGCVLIASAIVFQNIESALYGMLEIFASSSLIDSILYGLDKGKMMMIVSALSKDIAKRVHNELDRSCTILDGKGSYSDQRIPVLFCVVRKNQYFQLKKIVHEIDPVAFVIALEASEVIGEGFKSPEQNR